MSRQVRANEITRATPVELVALLLEAAVKTLDEGRDAMLSGDEPGTDAARIRAAALLDELALSVATEHDGSGINERLESLYAGLRDRLEDGEHAVFGDGVAALTPILAVWQDVVAEEERRYTT